MSDKSAEAASAKEHPGPKGEGSALGAFLISVRERRGMTIDAAVKETRIPDHYVRMIESNDYSLISDQLYVLPFLRRYAAFLKLDPEEVAMRFVREVQRADSAPGARTIEPIEMDRAPRVNWSRVALATGLVGIIVLAWMLQSHMRHRGATEMRTTAVSEQSNSASH